MDHRCQVPLGAPGRVSTLQRARHFQPADTPVSPLKHFAPQQSRSYETLAQLSRGASVRSPTLLRTLERELSEPRWRWRPCPHSESTRGSSRMQRAMVLDAEARVLWRTHNSVECCPTWQMRPLGHQRAMAVPRCLRRCRPCPEPLAGPLAPVATSVQCRFREPDLETPKNPSHLLRPRGQSGSRGERAVSNRARRSTMCFPIRNHWRNRIRRHPRARASSRAGR